MICPKCKHERTIADDPLIPDNQCPACGIIYEKYQQKNSIANYHRTPKEQLAKMPSIATTEESAKRLKMILAVGSILVIAAYSYMSPLKTVNDLRSALISQEASDLDEYVAFEKLRTNVKASIRSDLQRKLDTDLKGNPFAGFGQMIAHTMIDKAVETMVSPDGLKALFNYQTAGEKIDEDEYVYFDFDYNGFDRVTVDMENVNMKLEREGMFSWKVVNFIKK